MMYSFKSAPQGFWRLPLIGLSLAIILAACGSSPKGKAAELADRFPVEFGDWELNENRLELTAENQSNNGHVTLHYENGDDVRVDISIDVYATSTAANVEMGERVRNWELMGVRFDRLRPAGYDVAMLPGGYLAYLQDAETIFTLSIIPLLPEAEASETTELVDAATIEAFQELISAVVSNN
jgi:hypothetical protein